MTGLRWNIPSAKSSPQEHEECLFAVSLTRDKTVTGGQENLRDKWITNAGVFGTLLFDVLSIGKYYKMMQVLLVLPALLLLIGVHPSSPTSFDFPLFLSEFSINLESLSADRGPWKKLIFESWGACRKSTSFKSFTVVIAKEGLVGTAQPIFLLVWHQL